MNRFNFGNQTTNGMQMLGVSATTASAFEKQSQRAKLADASSALNNLSEEERAAWGQTQANKMRDEMNRYNAKGASPYQHLTNEEASKYQEKIAEGMRQKISGEEESIDDLMADTPYQNLNSPQAKAIKTYIENNFEFMGSYVRDGRRFRRMTEEDFINKLSKGGDNNANV